MAKPRHNARQITGAFTQDEVHLLAVAAKAYANMIDVHDTRHPDHDARDDASALRRLASELNEANAVRPFLD
jgi:hypothetical protein